MWNFGLKNLYKFISCGLVFFFLFLKHNVCQDDMSYDPLIPPSTDAPCHILAGFYVTRVMDIVNECTSKSDTGEVDRKRVRKNPVMPPINCVLKCVATELGLLNSEGKVAASTTAFFVQDKIPTRYQEFAFTVLSECFVKASHFIEVNRERDPNCSSYTKIFTCIVGAAPRLKKLCYSATTTPSSRTTEK